MTFIYAFVRRLMWHILYSRNDWFLEKFLQVFSFKCMLLKLVEMISIFIICYFVRHNYDLDNDRSTGNDFFYLRKLKLILCHMRFVNLADLTIYGTFLIFTVYRGILWGRLRPTDNCWGGWGWSVLCGYLCPTDNLQIFGMEGWCNSCCPACILCIIVSASVIKTSRRRYF